MVYSAVIAVAAAAIERGFLLGQLHSSDGAIVIAPLADKGGEGAFILHHLGKPLEPGLAAAHFFPGEHGGANGATDFAVFGHGQRFIFELLLEGSHHRLVVKDGAGEDDPVSELAVSHHLGQVVLGNGIGQAGGDNFEGHAFLLGGGDRLPHESGASGAQVDSMRGVKGQAGELAAVYRDAEHFGKLVNKTSGAGGTCLVHLVVNHHAIALDDQLGVLSANLDDVSFRVYFNGSSCLRGDFILDEVGPDETADQIPSGTGNSGAGNLDVGRAIQKQVAEDLLHRINGPSGSHQIAFGEHPGARIIEDNCLGARGADIDAEITGAWFGDFPV